MEKNYGFHDWPRVLRTQPLYWGPIQDMPVELRHPHTLHITVLKKDIVLPFEYAMETIVDATKNQIDMISALASEEFFSGWCLTYGTPAMFEDAGTLLLAEDKLYRLERPTLVGDSWGLSTTARRRGNQRYTATEKDAQKNLGAQLYRLERLLVGVMAGRVAGNAANQAQSILQDHIASFKASARGTTKRSDDLDYAYTRLRSKLGPKRLRHLHGGRALRSIAVEIELEGRSLASPGSFKDGWERHVPELVEELRTLANLLVLCRRAHRMHRFADSQLDWSGLDRADDPVVLMPERAAEQLVGFGSHESRDRMPDIVDLTRIALNFDHNAADIYPALGPVGMHLAAACAIGRRSRGASEIVTPHELWGLRGLSDDRFDAACPPRLTQAREMVRAFGLKKGDGRQNLPPSQRVMKGIHNMPIVVRPSSC